jgi:hypothetical protein
MSPCWLVLAGTRDAGQQYSAVNFERSLAGMDPACIEEALRRVENNQLPNSTCMLLYACEIAER